jgi:hypothetical protein
MLRSDPCLFFSQVEKLPNPERKQIVQILDAFLEREKLKKAS